MLRCLLALLVYTSLVSAQPWQWTHYQGTFWHPATVGLPWIDLNGPDLGEIEYRGFGDFNGNGRDEMIVMASHTSYNHWENPQDGDFFDWTTRTQTNPLYVFGEADLFLHAVNLDADAQDELLVFSRLSEEPFTQFVRCWDPDGAAAPHFTERPDLLAALAYPGFPAPSMLGNFDGDNSLDGITPTAAGWQRYERNGNNWTLVETLDITSFSEYSYYVAADINSDGDMEFGCYEPGLDCNCFSGAFVDYLNGQTDIYQNVYDLLLFPGDYDGDGTTESFLENIELTLPSRLVRLSAGEPFNVTELENQWEANSPFVFSTNSGGEHKLYGILNNWRFQIGTGGLVKAAYPIQWSDTGWTLTQTTGTFGGRILEGNSGDIWDDDAEERIFRLDIGTEFEDVIWSVGYGSLERFYQNPDTFFMNPRIGDVEGDGAGEFVTSVFSGAPRGLYFYTLERADGVLIAHYRPEMSAGLPANNITEFTLADIDNDGHAELFIAVGIWRSYFWRDGQWTEITVLPQGIGANLNFADFDGDGDLDAIAQNGVWISESPTSAEEVVPTPSSFSLSAYPNPFNPQTTIAFDLPKAGDVSLILFDVLGREVATLLNKRMNAGSHTVHYDATSLPSGVYFIRFVSDEFNASEKLLLLK